LSERSAIRRKRVPATSREEVSLNILFDTNVILDALLDRESFGEDAVLLFDAVERSVINGFIGATSVTTIYYLMEKHAAKVFACQKIALLLELFEVAPTTRGVLEEALTLGFSDYEDAVVHQSAVGVNADGIVTRNIADFKKSKIAVYSPRELITAVL
jgi:predicted nucleic acid-binding protein